MRPQPAHAREVVLELRELDLELALGRAGVVGEDVEDDRRAVDHRHAELLLEVALLARQQLVVDRDQVGVGLLHRLLQLGELAAAEVAVRVGPLAALHHLAGDGHAGGAQQLAQLGEIGLAGPDADRQRALARAPGIAVCRLLHRFESRDTSAGAMRAFVTGERASSGRAWCSGCATGATRWWCSRARRRRPPGSTREVVAGRPVRRRRDPRAASRAARPSSTSRPTTGSASPQVEARVDARLERQRHRARARRRRRRGRGPDRLRLDRSTCSATRTGQVGRRELHAATRRTASSPTYDETKYRAHMLAEERAAAGRADRDRPAGRRLRPRRPRRSSAR